ncbi:MAG TPA: peptidylprolyl isomerase [Oligoflexus sp.]|jgi:FKBP-type peptidyl-prolyl cis-trans isomerase SlyD|uniref:FKBP-type peptidyl-prolyl cis-trans isomerase n=1 Tax=Oligoflexus sp. TaxID=1971216 RepID=UPI002D7EC4B2|nr:peptidylprolyl isomerase [Oligoflexus sp.]HET9239740.1 peptidylprolyl isomerase [Oligoflexus sp.]
MIAGQNSVVLMDYTVKDDEGNLIDTSAGQDPLAFILGMGNIIPGLERAFIGKKKGDSFQVRVKPEEGYGERDEALVEVVPRTQFSGIKDLRPGMQLQAQTDDEVMVVTVVKLTDKEVTVDANHPLAGKTLNFDVAVVDVRTATQEELAHGHVHGVGGHHH